jgi:hypothetical protein
MLLQYVPKGNQVSTESKKAGTNRLIYLKQQHFFSPQDMAERLEVTLCMVKRLLSLDTLENVLYHRLIVRDVEEWCDAMPEWEVTNYARPDKSVTAKALRPEDFLFRVYGRSALLEAEANEKGEFEVYKCIINRQSKVIKERRGVIKQLSPGKPD